jgi:hypothetical protein
MIHTPPTEAPEVGPDYLAGTAYFDSTSEIIQRFVRETVAGETAATGKAVPARGLGRFNLRVRRHEDYHESNTKR